MAHCALTRSLQRFLIIRNLSYLHLIRGIATTKALCTERRYTKKHEWVTLDGDVATVGITDFAQAALGDIVYAELPDVGKELSAGDAAGAVESVKAASDVYSPVSGTVTDKNVEVENNPALINKSAFENGWLYKLKVKSADELKELMNEEAYEEFKKIEEEEAQH